MTSNPLSIAGSLHAVFAIFFKPLELPCSGGSFVTSPTLFFYPFSLPLQIRAASASSLYLFFSNKPMDLAKHDVPTAHAGTFYPAEGSPKPRQRLLKLVARRLLRSASLHIWCMHGAFLVPNCIHDSSALRALATRDTSRLSCVSSAGDVKFLVISVYT